MRIFDHIDAFRVNVLIEQLKRRNHMVINVASIVKNDVYSWIFIYNLSDNFRVFLAADKDLDRILFMFLALGIYVKADNACASSEILSPHLQRAPPKDADLKYDWGEIAKPREVSFINIKIVDPFVKSLGRVFQEVSVEETLIIQAIHECIEF